MGGFDFKRHIRNRSRILTHQDGDQPGYDAMFFFDLTMEPAAIALGYWTWEQGAVPLANYLSWFLLGFVFLLLHRGTRLASTVKNPFGSILAISVTSIFAAHIFINIGLQIFTATAMAIILQIGVVVSAVIALFTFGEIPSVIQVVGSALVIIGVVIATIEQNRIPGV